jgi:hypothetical protein
MMLHILFLLSHTIQLIIDAMALRVDSTEQKLRFAVPQMDWLAEHAHDSHLEHVSKALVYSTFSLVTRACSTS